MPEENKKNEAGRSERETGVKPDEGEEDAPREGEAATAPSRGRQGIRKEKADSRGGEREAREGERELESVRRERDELRDKYLRSLAEAENQRKRAERDKSEYFQFALAETLKEFLGVVDSLERALKAESRAEGESFLEGVRRIHKQVLDVLAKQGVTPISDAVGSRFDPNIHQALTTEESEDVEDPRVAEELQRGYRLQDRLLRPVLVRVVVPKKGSQT